MTLDKREAALRTEAVAQLLGADGRIAGGALLHAMRNRPKAALLAIKRAEARLGRAKAALRKWAR